MTLVAVVTLEIGSSAGEADVAFSESLVQQGIELGPHLIFLCAGDMAIRALVQGFHLRGWRFRLMVIEIEEAPPLGVRKTLGILDRHIGAIEGSGEIAPLLAARSKQHHGRTRCPSGNSFVLLISRMSPAQCRRCDTLGSRPCRH